jgi:hypothetical protein
MTVAITATTAAAEEKVRAVLQACNSRSFIALLTKSN